MGTFSLLRISTETRSLFGASKRKDMPKSDNRAGEPLFNFARMVWSKITLAAIFASSA